MISQPLDYLPSEAKTIVSIVGVISLLNGLAMLGYVWFYSA